MSARINRGDIRDDGAATVSSESRPMRPRSTPTTTVDPRPRGRRGGVRARHRRRGDVAGRRANLPRASNPTVQRHPSQRATARNSLEDRRAARTPGRVTSVVSDRSSVFVERDGPFQRADQARAAR